MPHAIPVSGRRALSHFCDPFHVQSRWAVCRSYFETALKLPLSRRPFPLPIGLKAVFKLITQFMLTSDQLSRPAQKLIDADWFASAHDCDQIKFASFHLLPPKAKGVLADNNPRSVYFVGTDKPRGHIDGVANYREAFGGGGSDRAHDYFSGRNSHTHAKSGRAAPQPD